MKYITLIALLTISSLQAKHLHKEAYYQKIVCNKMNGQIEYRLPDKTRIDCLTKGYAIEFDFANKWAESIGQSLYYGTMTERNAGVVLIMERGSKDMRYLKRLNKVARDHNITVWTVDSALTLKRRQIEYRA